MKSIHAMFLSLLFISSCVPHTRPESTFTPTATRVPALLAPVSTLKPTPTQTPTPEATSHPMSIEALRLGSYPGSEIVVESELTPGSNYERFYVYYLSEGLKIHALLTIPTSGMPENGWPAIVFNHGYIPPDVYVTTERYVNYVDRLASSGYIVFRIDYRGHDRSEGEASGAYGDPGYLVDVLNAIASIKQYPSADPNRIGLWGHSMGGYLVLRAMVITKDINAGVIWAGVVAPYEDLLYNWRRSGSFTPSPSSRGRGWRTEWIDLYGTPEINPQFWDSISANSFLADLSGPLQLHHGTEDEDVPLAFSENLAIQLRSINQPYEFFIYDGDNHNLSRYFTTAMNRTIAFYDTHLKR